ncbi:hypothetical protein CEN46_17015 [Fischerella thermalis CCMEE 5318]|uniref:Uncharacterized protein n=1 Tax=Fischerella thermalis CCMEE 5318 TaxID=2019666 RepID=A0A2N6LBU8_9CYAN|nr:hypothetical protein CEN46_17015 [Fischerella thermalis CCMEE 5318]
MKKECDRSIDRIQTRKAIPNPESKIQKGITWLQSSTFLETIEGLLQKLQLPQKGSRVKGFFFFPPFARSPL